MPEKIPKRERVNGKYNEGEVSGKTWKGGERSGGDSGERLEDWELDGAPVEDLNDVSKEEPGRSERSHPRKR